MISATMTAPINSPISASTFGPAMAATESQVPCSSIGIAIRTKPRPILRGSAGGPAEKVDDTGAEDGAVQNVSSHSGEHAKDDGADRCANLVGAELGSGRRH